jgi:hypothetical protein
MAQPARVKFITKRGDWVTETCHDILTCREHGAALERTRKVLNATDRNLITNILPDEVGAEADDSNSVSFEEYNNIPESLSGQLAEDILAVEGVPPYILNSLSDIVYHMDDVTFFNQNNEAPEYRDVGEGEWSEDDYDIDEPTLGDFYRHPELIWENQTEVAQLVQEEFGLFGEQYGFKSEVMTRSYGISEHSVVKITGEDGRSWVADFNVHSYDENQPFPWITSYANWSQKVDGIVGDFRAEDA